MTHIKEKNGEKCNYLALSADDYYALDEYLRALGIRSRMISYTGDIVLMQSENPYKDWLKIEASSGDKASHALKRAEYFMTDDEISAYKR